MVVDLLEIAPENLEVALLNPVGAVVGDRVRGLVGPDVGIIKIHGPDNGRLGRDAIRGRTQAQDLDRYGVPVGVQFGHRFPQAPLIVGPATSLVLVGGARSPHVVTANVPGDDLRASYRLAKGGVVAKGVEKLRTGPAVTPQVGEPYRGARVGLGVGLVAGHVATKSTETRSQRVA